MTDKERIEELLRSSGRRNIERVITYLNESDFYTAHPARHHLQPGGLARHCLEVYETMRSNACWMMIDSIIITALLHDIATASHPATSDYHGHGRRSVAILEEVCDFPLQDEERSAILYHLHPDAKEIKYNPLALCLCFADGLSAAKHPRFYDEKRLYEGLDGYTY